MNDSPHADEALDLVSKVLLWCFGFAIAFMLFWFLVFVLLGDSTYNLHAEFFPICLRWSGMRRRNPRLGPTARRRSPSKDRLKEV